VKTLFEWSYFQSYNEDVIMEKDFFLIEKITLA